METLISVQFQSLFRYYFNRRCLHHSTSTLNRNGSINCSNNSSNNSGNNSGNSSGNNSGDNSGNNSCNNSGSSPESLPPFYLLLFLRFSDGVSDLGGGGLRRTLGSGGRPETPDAPVIRAEPVSERIEHLSEKGAEMFAKDIKRTTQFKL